MASWPRIKQQPKCSMLAFSIFQKKPLISVYCDFFSYETELLHFSNKLTKKNDRNKNKMWIQIIVFRQICLILSLFYFLFKHTMPRISLKMREVLIPLLIILLLNLKINLFSIDKKKWKIAFQLSYCALLLFKCYVRFAPTIQPL